MGDGGDEGPVHYVDYAQFTREGGLKSETARKTLRHEHGSVSVRFDNGLSMNISITPRHQKPERGDLIVSLSAAEPQEHAGGKRHFGLNTDQRDAIRSTVPEIGNDPTDTVPVFRSSRDNIEELLERIAQTQPPFGKHTNVAKNPPAGNDRQTGRQ